MTLRTQMQRIFQQEDINFLLTNRLPRRLLTQFIGWFSRIEQAPIPRLSISLWRLFSDLDLSDAGIRRFRSMHECFTRQLKAGARPIDPDPSVLVSPCDAIVGACGTVVGNELLQIKGFPYTLDDLLGRSADAYQNGRYVTLRLTSSMYHRFHAPHDCRVELVTYISGDTWNVNPIALKRVERLFCKNERVVVDTRLALGQPVTMVAVAAILVASVRLHFLDVVLNLRHRGPNVISCDATLVKGQEMGWFEHGSTIIVLVPDGFTQCEDVYEGRTIRVGEPLLRLP
ncbi:MAG: archaetidylserine decarboxylase [Pseudolabrys sp.]|jgi:phosphatidylserine decarboxylase